MFLPRRLLDRYSWDEKRVVELYRRSVERRKDLGMDAVKREIQRDNLQLDSLPHAKEVRSVISVNGSSSVDKAYKTATEKSAELAPQGRWGRLRRVERRGLPIGDGDQPLALGPRRDQGVGERGHERPGIRMHRRVETKRRQARTERGQIYWCVRHGYRPLFFGGSFF